MPAQGSFQRRGLILVCGLLAAAATVAAADAAAPPATWLGRFFPGAATDGSMELPQLMSWAASSVSFAFMGSSIEVVIDGSLASLPPGHTVFATRAGQAGDAAAARFPWCSFQFALDGQVSVAVTSPVEPVLAWTRQLPEGRHTLTITKLTQPRTGSAWLQSVTVGGGSFLAPPPSPGQASGPSGRRMLFMGDSFTAGNGNAANSRCSSLFHENEDALRSFALATARHSKADAQLLAWGAAGLNVPVRWKRNGQPFTPAERQVVVLAAGTNDFRAVQMGGELKLEGAAAPELAPIDAWLDKWEAYVCQVWAAYPRAAIIQLAWPLEQLAGALGPFKIAAYLQYMAAAHTRLQTAHIDNTHFLQIVGEGFTSLKSWCRGHPDAATHANIAQQLIQFINAVSPGWAGAAA